MIFGNYTELSMTMDYFNILFVHVGIGHCNPLSAVCRITSSTGHDLGYSSTSNLHHDNSSKADLVLTYTFTQTASGVQCPVVTTDIQFVCNRSSPVGVSDITYRNYTLHRLMNIIINMAYELLNSVR